MNEPSYIYQSFLGGMTPGREVPDFRSWDGSNGRPYAIKRVYDRNKDGTRGTYLTTTPNFSALNDASTRQLQRFLYRVTSDQSGGLNQLGDFQSQSRRVNSEGTDFTSLDPPEVRQRLELHLRNARSHDGKLWHSPFISFTDSFMTAIYLGKQAQREGRTNIQIHIIDTMQLAEPTLIFHAYALLKSYRVWHHVKNTTAYAFKTRPTYTEFLVWETLKVEAAMIPFNKLCRSEYGGTCMSDPIDFCDEIMETALHRQNPDKEPRRRGQLRVPSELRPKLYPDVLTKSYHPTDYVYDRWHGQRLKWSKDCETRTEMDRYKLLQPVQTARLVPVEFQLDLLIALASMRTKVYTEESIVDNIVKALHDDPMCHQSPCYATGLNTSMKCEVFKQQELMRRCCEALGQNIIIGGKRPMRNLCILRSNGASRRPILHTVSSYMQAKRARRLYLTRSGTQEHHDATLGEDRLFEYQDAMRQISARSGLQSSEEDFYGSQSVVVE